MRQYRILYKRGINGNFRPLEKFVHAPIYERPEVSGRRPFIFHAPAGT